MVHLGFPLPTNEYQRLQALAQYRLLDTPPEEEFDRLTALAARIFDAPIALMSLMDVNRQFFKSKIGTELRETSRHISFCAHTTLNDGIMIVHDALDDARFKNSPLVVGPPHVRFYAGMPLTTAQGYTIGTLCIADTVPRRTFSVDEQMSLVRLADLMMDHLELHRLRVAAGMGRFRFREIAATSNEAVFLCAGHQRVTFWNRAAEALFGFSQTEMLVQQTLSRLFSSEDWTRYRGDLDNLLAMSPDQRPPPFVLRTIRSNGAAFACEFTPIRVNEQQQKRIGFIAKNIIRRTELETPLLRALHRRGSG